MKKKTRLPELPFAVAMFIVLSGTALFVLGIWVGNNGGRWDGTVESSLEEIVECPELECPGAEQHPVEKWVCEREEVWSKVLDDCVEEGAAADALMDMTGELELELERWKSSCRPSEADHRELIDQLKRDTHEAARALAARRVIERKLAEGDTDG